MTHLSVLLTPPVPRIVPESVFDAFAWIESDALEWRRGAAWDGTSAVTTDNPARMVFVFRRGCDFLPREFARLHAPGLGFEEEWALAPYAIDDATDELYARRVRPRDLLWLVADHLAALAWGLHDWAHFHNHGAFVERAWTELQCDASSLAWLWLNRVQIGIEEATWERLRLQFESLSCERFGMEGIAFDRALLAASTLRSLLGDSPRPNRRRKATFEASEPWNRTSTEAGADPET